MSRRALTVAAIFNPLRSYFGRCGPTTLPLRRNERWCHTRNREYTSSGAYIIDLRSDTLSQPTQGMLHAMANATYKDDVFNEDPTIKELQDKMADIFGMEAALFVPSGTMGNLIAVMCHCNRGAEVLLGHESHLVIYEQGGLAQIGGIMPRTMPNRPDGTFDLDDMASYIRPRDDPHQPLTTLIAVENTHGNFGGKVLPMDFLGRLRDRADEFGLPIHMDGARVLNAAVALNLEPREILKYTDSVSVCLSKGVGTPIGSVIGGSATLIKRAVRLRKVLGGGWRQPGPLAAAALVALRDYRERLTADHRHTKLLAHAIKDNHYNILDVDVNEVHTNLLMVQVVNEKLLAKDFTTRLSQVTEEEVKTLGHKTIINCFPVTKNVFRLAFCHNISTEDVQLAIDKMKYITSEMAHSIA